MNYGEVARYAGLDPYAQLGRAGLHPTGLGDPENWLPARNVLSLLRDSAMRSGRDDFGVLLGECRTFASLGPVSLLLRHEANLRQVIAAMIEYRRLLNELLHLSLRDDGNHMVLEWNLVPGLRSSQGVNLLATIAYRVLVDWAGISWQPECIHFRHAMPKQVATFRRVFRCRLEFDSELDGLSGSSACLDLRNKFAEPELAAHARRLLQLIPGIWQGDSMTERVESAIPFLISNGRVRAEDVANCLGVPVRTLQRRLAVEGKPFNRLLTEARRDLAIRYLDNSSHSITMVAQLTGYSSVSSFIRWFMAEFGMPPGQWRKVMRRRNALHFSSPG